MSDTSHVPNNTAIANDPRTANANGSLVPDLNTGNMVDNQTGQYAGGSGAVGTAAGKATAGLVNSISNPHWIFTIFLWVLAASFIVLGAYVITASETPRNILKGAIS